MSQVEPCYLYANPTSLLCLITRTISLRLQRWNENRNVRVEARVEAKSKVVSCDAEGFSSAFLRSLFTTLDPRQETKRQVQNSSADQAGSTTSVSLSTAALSLTGVGDPSSPTAATSSSEEPTPTPFSSPSTSAADAQTYSSSQASISAESATTETVYSSTRSSITIRDTSSSVSTWADTSSLDPPQSPSSIQTISTSRTSSRTTTETFTQEPSTSFSSREPRKPLPDPSSSSSSRRSGNPPIHPPTSSAPPTTMSSLTPISSDDDSSTIPLTTVFSSTIIGVTSTSVIVLPLPTSDSSSSSLSAASETTTSSEPEPPTSSSSSSSDLFPSTSSTNSIPLPATITSSIPLPGTITSSILLPTTITNTQFVTVFTDGGTSTSSSVVGVLRTDGPTPSGFARNTGAIIAVSLSAVVGLILAVLAIFFAFKRYKSRSNTASMENILALAREVSLRRPVDGEDDDSVIGGYGGSHSPFRNRPLDRSSPSGEGSGGLGGASGQLLAEGGRLGSAESSNPGMAPPLNPAFGGQPYMPTYGQTALRPVGQPDPFSRYASVAGQDSSQTSRGIRPRTYYEGSGGQNHRSPGGSGSAISLTLAGSSSGGHGSSSGESSRAKPPTRVSPTGSRPIPPSIDGHRHSSAPPAAFMGGVREPFFDHERQQHPEQSDKASARSFLTRLRNGRRTSLQSLATVRGGRAQATQGSMESLMSPEPSNLYSPSLLNPPVIIPPSRAILRFPRGVTGNSYTPLPPEMSERYTSGPSSGPWPPVTLPPPPSPAPTDDSSMVEGLLHPRLGRGTDRLQQASTASLRDNEDYTRPINGLVNNHVRSTTTFEILDTTGSEEGPMAI